MSDIKMEEIGTHYAKLFSIFLSSIMEYDKVIDGLIEEERAVSDIKDEYALCMKDARVNSEKRVKEVAQRMIKRMVSRAEKLFAPPGGTLAIDIEKVKETCGYDHEHHHRDPAAFWKLFDAKEVWRYLMSTYNGEKGQDVGHSQTAAAIIKGFYLSPGQQIKTVGNRMILEQTIWIDSFDKKYTKKNRISYNCAESVSKNIAALACFAAWAEMDALVLALKAASRHIADYHHEIASRAVYGGHGIRIVTYTNKYVFQLDPPVAEALHIFIAEYGYLDAREAA